MKKAIFLYDYTGIMALPWLNNGYECWSFDGQHSSGVNQIGHHVQVGMWFDASNIEKHATQIANMVGDNVKLVFGFPECTDLTSAGAKHWEKKRKVDPDFQIKAIRLALLVELVGKYCHAPWAFENPVGAMSTLYRLPDFKFHPCDYGGYITNVNDIHPLYPNVYPPNDAYKKQTCIWFGLGFITPDRKPVVPTSLNNPGWIRCGGKSQRTKNIRSITPRGFAQAVYLANAL